MYVCMYVCGKLIKTIILPSIRFEVFLLTCVKFATKKNYVSNTQIFFINKINLLYLLITIQLQIIF